MCSLTQSSNYNSKLEKNSKGITIFHKTLILAILCVLSRPLAIGKHLQIQSIRTPQRYSEALQFKHKYVWTHTRTDKH